MEDVENKIPDVSKLVTNSALNKNIGEVENKILNHDIYITTQEFTKLTSENFAARLKQVNLATKNQIADFVKQKDFDNKLKNINKKLTSNKTKHNTVKKKLNDLSKEINYYY